MFRVKGKRVSSVFYLQLILGVAVLYWFLKWNSPNSTANRVSDDYVHETPSSPNSFAWKDDITPEFLANFDKKTLKCEKYTEYSKKKHGPFSKGRRQYPFQRPPPKCRTFRSDAIETLIADLKGKILDPDLARLMENALPNTLDTAILWHKPANPNSKNSRFRHPQTFIVTGDIHAEWLRDSARQLQVFMPLLPYDQKLQELVKGAIRTQEEYVVAAPYCNAFHLPPGSGIKRGSAAKDDVYPPPDPRYVFECKYEIDSLASFLTLTNDYLTNTKDMSVITNLWLEAYETILTVLMRESLPLFDPDHGRLLPFFYSFQRQTNIGSETLPLAGTGNPVNSGTGLIRSAFRPSDDATILQFFVPGNAHMLVELRRTLTLVLRNLRSPKIDKFIQVTERFIDLIEKGLKEHAIIDHPKWGQVYAYEVDGYGGAIFMDDANIPSLLSLPEVQFTDMNDEVYQNTRKMIFSTKGNPYYLLGPFFEGIGGPHIGLKNAWPMSLLMRIRTTDDDEEILKNLDLIMDSTAGLGLLHESVNVYTAHGNDYTRPWFAWCNSEFGRTILHLAKHKPHLIFRKEVAQPYDIDALFASKLQLG